jgi:hypothetical protein
LKIAPIFSTNWYDRSVYIASSTTKTGRHDIAEILLKVALKHQKSNLRNRKYFHIKQRKLMSLEASLSISVKSLLIPTTHILLKSSK